MSIQTEINNKTGENSVQTNQSINEKQESTDEQTLSSSSSTTSSVSASTDPNNNNQLTQTSFNLDEFIRTQLKENVRNRTFMLNIERDLINFLRNEKHEFYKFQPMNPYYRMLVHRIGEYFGLGHNLDHLKQSVIVFKTDKTKMPLNDFQSIINESTKILNQDQSKLSITSSESSILTPNLSSQNLTTLENQPEQKKQILKREVNQDNDSNKNNQNSKKQSDFRPKTFEEKSAEYIRVKNRIFNNDTNNTCLNSTTTTDANNDLISDNKQTQSINNKNSSFQQQIQNQTTNPVKQYKILNRQTNNNNNNNLNNNINSNKINENDLGNINNQNQQKNSNPNGNNNKQKTNQSKANLNYQQKKQQIPAQSYLYSNNQQQHKIMNKPSSPQIPLSTVLMPQQQQHQQQQQQQQHPIQYHHSTSQTQQTQQPFYIIAHSASYPNTNNIQGPIIPVSSVPNLNTNSPIYNLNHLNNQYFTYSPYQLITHNNQSTGYIPITAPNQYLNQVPNQVSQIQTFSTQTLSYQQNLNKDQRHSPPKTTTPAFKKASNNLNQNNNNNNNNNNNQIQRSTSINQTLNVNNQLTNSSNHQTNQKAYNRSQTFKNQNNSSNNNLNINNKQKVNKNYSNSKVTSVNNSYEFKKIQVQVYNLKENLTKTMLNDLLMPYVKSIEFKRKLKPQTNNNSNDTNEINLDLSNNSIINENNVDVFIEFESLDKLEEAFKCFNLNNLNLDSNNEFNDQAKSSSSSSSSSEAALSTSTTPKTTNSAPFLLKPISTC